MINSMNILGRLTKDVDLRYTPNGKAVANGTLAVQRSFTNAQGNRDADFINFVIWGRVAEVVADRTGKGKMIGGTGRMQSRTFESDGKTIFVTEMVIENVTIVEWNDNGGQGNPNQGNQNQGNQNQRNQNQGNRNNQDNDPFKNNGQPIDINDDDLPF